MLRLMCNVKWSERVSSVSLLEKLMIPSITSQLSQNRLRWFGHVKRSDGTINSIVFYEAPRKIAPGRPKKTWSEIFKKDLSD